MERDKVFNLKVLFYGDITRYKIFDRPIYVADNCGKTGVKGQAKDPDKSIRESIRRAKEKIHGYVMCNDWQYWATQTFAPEKMDRYNLDEIIRRYNKKLQNLKQRKYPELKWLIVPEQHKDGAWHLHMFCSGIPADRVVDSGHVHYNLVKQYARRIYNWVDTIDFGFNDYLYIGDLNPLERFKMANYVTKYITKDLAETRFNKKMYWVSRGLQLPNITNTFVGSPKKVIPSSYSITHRTYHIKDNDTGEVYNTITDITFYNSLPF